MGTRATATIYDDSPLCTIYAQCDGYPSEFGKNLARFRVSKTIINGFSNEEMKDHANGMGCFAAQLIGHLKNRLGGIYIYAHKEAKKHDYHYNLKQDEIECYGLGVLEFRGTYEDFLAWCEGR